MTIDGYLLKYVFGIAPFEWLRVPGAETATIVKAEEWGMNSVFSTASFFSAV